MALAEPSLTSKSQHADQHVILVTIDGFPARFWRDQSLPLPNLRRLAREGAAAEAMTVSNPSITWINHTRISRTISAIGKNAGVVVNKAEEKYASAHDLPRSFGTRWASRVKPATLQLLMRQKSTETTLKD